MSGNISSRFFFFASGSKAASTRRNEEGSHLCLSQKSIYLQLHNEDEDEDKEEENFLSKLPVRQLTQYVQAMRDYTGKAKLSVFSSIT